MTLIERRMDYTTHVPELQNDFATFAVHSLGDLAPPIHLLFVPDSRRVGNA